MKHYLSYLGLRAGAGLVGALPGPLVRGLGRGFGRAWSRVDIGRRTMARRHADRVLDNGADIEEVSADMMTSYGRYFAEALWFRARRVAAMLEQTEVIGIEHITNARDAGTGMIYALPHMGNWEAAAPVAISQGVPVVAVAEVLPNRRITDWFTKMRAEFGIEIVLATGRVEVMRRLEEAIRQNKAVALLSDRDLKGRGVEVEFFGEKTTLPPGPATLALRTGAPILPVGCYFRDGGHRVVIHPPLPVPAGGSRPEQVVALTQALAERLEAIISEAPSQWHLVQPNWPSDRLGEE
ncbi:MAG TPA: phosphatidylinositol mannoside acyltransferase [Acidimicrobiia bacterium]|nr:phosphatidylinositol mannoside acyltransferase [Acidimicrobiia bacterium]